MIIKITNIKLFAALLFSIVILSSCFKSENFPLEPVISNPEVVTMGDTAIVTFSFTDGDADIGLAADDTNGVYSPGSYFYNNIYLDYFEKDDVLGWVPGMDVNGDTVRFSFRIKPIQVSENTEGIKGTIDVTLEAYQNPFSTQSDTVKFKIKLIDRALNESNEIETLEIISG
jgi:hypothetical protein